MTRRGKIGVYGAKTRKLQRRLSFEAYGLSMKDAEFYLYLGDRNSFDPSINDVGTYTFMEVPDKLYSNTPVTIPIGYDPIPSEKTDLSRFGIIDPISNETRFTIHFDDTEELGRVPVEGDIFVLPFNKEIVDTDARWEITDVDDSLVNEQFIITITAVPLTKSRRNDSFIADNGSDEPSALSEMFGAQEEEWMDDVPANKPSVVHDEQTPLEPNDKQRGDDIDMFTSDEFGEF